MPGEQDDVGGNPDARCFRVDVRAAVVEEEAGVADAPIGGRIVVENGTELYERFTSADGVPRQIAILFYKHPCLMLDTSVGDLPVLHMYVFEGESKREPASLLPTRGAEPLRVALGARPVQYRNSRVAAAGGVHDAAGASIVGLGPWSTSSATVNARGHCPSRSSSAAVGPDPALVTKAAPRAPGELATRASRTRTACSDATRAAESRDRAVTRPSVSSLPTVVCDV